MREKDLQEGLGELADRAERDHEVQMARADLYKIAKYAIKLHDLLKNVTEEQGLEGWVQKKITKSSDYISSVYHHLDYEQATGEINDNEVSVEESAGASCGCGPSCACGGNCGPNCNCGPDCGNVSEGKFKSDAHRKAVHAGKASGMRKKKSLRKESLEDRLTAKLEEKITSKTDMGDVIKDFQKSDAPQFKGKSKEKKRQMAIAAKLGSESVNNETTKISPANISASKIKSKKLEPKTK